VNGLTWFLLVFCSITLGCFVILVHHVNEQAKVIRFLDVCIANHQDTIRRLVNEQGEERTPELPPMMIYLN